jgi:hypothetical protein
MESCNIYDAKYTSKIQHEGVTYLKCMETRREKYFEALFCKEGDDKVFLLVTGTTPGGGGLGLGGCKWTYKCMILC